MFLFYVVAVLSQNSKRHFGQSVRCVPGNPGLHLQAVPEALAENPACGTIPSYNLPRTTRGDASACSSALRTQEYRHVRRLKRGYRTTPTSSPSALRSSVPTERFFGATADPNCPGPV